MLKDQLRNARKAAKKTQKEVADHIGVTESAYCGYETGKRQPDALKIRKIADFLGVTGDYLLETDTLPERELPVMRENTAIICMTPDEERLLKFFRILNHEGQQMILEHAIAIAGNPNMREKPISKKEIS